MKGKKLCASALACLLILTGCSSDTTLKEDGKYVIAKINNENIYADDLYETLKDSSSGPTLLFDYAITQLIDAVIPINDDMVDNAKTICDNIKSNYQSNYGSEYEEYLESDLASTGYATLDAYEQSLIETLQYSEFIKQYVKDHFDEVYEDYYKLESPRILSMIKISVKDTKKMTDEEKAAVQEIDDLIAAGKDFGEIAYSYSDDASATSKGNLGVVDSTTNLIDFGEDVEKTALGLAEGEMSEAILGEDGYYYFYCTSTDKEVIKKELDSVTLDSPLLIYDDYMMYMAFKSYEVNYSDDTVKSMIEQVIEEALNYRAELRG